MRRHSDKFTKRVKIFDRDGTQNFFGANKTSRFAVTADNVQAVMKPHTFVRFVGNLAANFAQSSGNVARRVRRIKSPARRLQISKFFRRKTSNSAFVRQKFPRRSVRRKKRGRFCCRCRLQKNFRFRQLLNPTDD